MSGLTRAAVVGFLTAGALTLSACGGGDGAGGNGGGDGGTEEPTGRGDGDVTLNMAWWGSDVRHGITEEVIDAFEAEHPNITIVGQPGEWAGYWDRLATTVAAGDMPDIVQMDEKFISTYAGRDALLDLSTLENLDTSAIDPGALASGELDGSLYGLVVGIGVVSVFANLTLLEEAGVPAPDDTTWTWEDFREIGQQVTENTAPNVYGVQYMGLGDTDLRLWVRQHGETLWTEDGQFGASVETVASFWEYVLSLVESGAAAPPSTAQEWYTAGLSGSGTGTNQAAFGLWWHSQLSAMAEVSGQDLVHMMPPVLADAEDSGLYYKPSMYWSASANTEHPEEVGLFLDFLVNSPEAGELLLVERGVPANPEVREHIAGMLSEVDQAVVDYVDRVADVVGEAAPVTPEGAADTEFLVQRYTFEVLFGALTPQEAAERFVAEAQAMVS